MYEDTKLFPYFIHGASASKKAYFEQEVYNLWNSLGVWMRLGKYGFY